MAAAAAAPHMQIQRSVPLPHQGRQDPDWLTGRTIRRPFVMSGTWEAAMRRHRGGVRASALGLGVASRRELLLGLSSLALGLVREAGAAPVPIPGYKRYVDRFDGYSLSVPADWMQVRGAGADVFFRAPTNLDENVIVDVSSPSSSRYKGVADLGTPQEAGKKVLQQYLTEFMSTRIGVRRESNIVSTNSRIADDGRLYYEVEVNVKSYANNNELAVMPQDRVVQLEWSRRYLTVLGVENSRLYQLRLQTPERVLAEEEGDLRQIMASFRVFKLA